MEAYMNTRGNLYYTKLRDDINGIQKRIYNQKQKEIDEKNEKMFKKLTDIQKKESQYPSKDRSTNSLGPKSLNIALRKQSIQRLNHDNIKLSERICNAQCHVERVESHRKFFQEHKKTQKHMTIWNQDG